MAGGTETSHVRGSSPAAVVASTAAPPTLASGFVELRAHSAFSFGDGAVSPEALVRRARQLGYSHIALTDSADFGGVARFAMEALSPVRDPGCVNAPAHESLGADPCPVCERVINPIIGAELEIDGAPAAFIAVNAEGYRNIAAMVTLARVGHWDRWEKSAQQKRRGRPGITWDDLSRHTAGVHALTGPSTGALASRILAGDEAAARRVLGEWRELFGERLAVEVQLHHTGGRESALASALIELAEKNDAKWVVAQDSRYVDTDGRLVHDVLTALRHETTVDDALERGLLRANGEWMLHPPGAVARRWRGRLEGVRESLRIARACEPFQIGWMRPPLPGFPPTAAMGDDPPMSPRELAEFLRTQTYAGARERWGERLTREQETQIERELGMIARLGFGGFFLVMWDAIRFARSRGILCQGRGSAANSAVAFCLGITAVDPIAHGLLFERFISEIRVEGKAEAPDIDVDFEHERREEVLDYVYEHWHRSHAAITAVTQMYRGPNAIRDSMRALGYPVELALQFSKRLGWSEPADAADRIRDELALAHGLDVSTARGQALLRTIAAFDGMPRMRSTHVGGFVLSSGQLGHWLPMEQTAMGRTILHFDKDDLDEIGVPKFDFLGLGALTMTRIAFDVIESRTGKRPEMYSLPTDDVPTYEIVQRGETIGTFQIESRAQIASILHTKPDRLYDLVVQVALIRPGPIQAKFVHPYTERRLGREPVTYAHPALEPILRRTQGIPIFQEQAMAIAMALGGYSGSDADALRRTMGNERKKERLLRELEKLRAAMISRRVEPQVADQICEDLVSFANYGFPESHAWSFALIAYATTWLKAHYPTEFYIGLLNAQPMGFYPISTLIHDARRFGVEVRPPCLGAGDWECTAEDGQLSAGACGASRPAPAAPLGARHAQDCRPALRIGWRFIRGIGDQVIDALRSTRDAKPFDSIGDVVRRAGLDRGDVLALARAGAFAAWLPDRRHAAWEGLRATGDILPLAPASDHPHAPPPVTKDQLVLQDYHALGLSLNGHPMERARPRLQRGGAKSSAEIARIPGGRTITVGGLVTIRQRPATANGTIFLLLEDEHGFINVVVSAEMVKENEEVVKRAPFVLVQGRLEKNGAVINVVGRKFAALEIEGLTFRSRDFR
jgi:error-prone DNA polymerase